MDSITIKGAREHHLKNLDLVLEHTGVLKSPQFEGP